MATLYNNNSIPMGLDFMPYGYYCKLAQISSYPLSEKYFFWVIQQLVNCVPKTSRFKNDKIFVWSNFMPCHPPHMAQFSRQLW